MAAPSDLPAAVPLSRAGCPRAMRSGGGPGGGRRGRPRLLAITALVAAALALAPATGDAFWARRSPGQRLNMNLSLGGTPFDTLGYGQQSFNSLAELALARWNEIGVGRTPDHSFFSVTSPGRPASQCGRDGINEVRFAAADCDGFSFGDAIAISMLWLQNGRILEADVMFDQTLPWNGYPGPMRRAVGAPIDFFRVVLHEFGHAFGLGHPDEIGEAVTAVMNSRISDVDSAQPDDIAGARAIAWSPDGGMGPVLAAAILPASRSIRVGVPATAFATIINTAPAPATSCRLAAATPVPATFTFQTTHPTTNQPTGSPGTPVAIPGGGSQTFVLAFTPSADLAPVDVAVSFLCDNTDPAPRITGVNTLQLSASSTAVPDVVALAATVSGDGTVHVPGPAGTGAFAVATVNLGAGGSITAVADTGAAVLPLDLRICQTNPATGACLGVPGPTVTVPLASSASPTFAIFAQANGAIPFDPAGNRVFVRFVDGSGVVRGATSVAVRTP
jgi:hypothetical protein